MYGTYYRRLSMMRMCRAMTRTHRRTRTSTATLYQFDICPYCNKVKALLKALNHPFDVVEVNPSSKREIKDLDSSLKSVPVLQSGDTIIDDSNKIYTYLLEEHAESSPPQHSEKWVKWADEKFAVLLFPNISRTFGDAFRAFDYVHRVPTFDIKTKISNRFIGAFAMWAFARRKVKKKYGIEDEREALREAIGTWSEEIKGKTYGGGDVPHTGDIAVYGCLRAIERMPAFAEVMAMDSNVEAWYSNMSRFLDDDQQHGSFKI